MFYKVNNNSSNLNRLLFQAVSKYYWDLWCDRLLDNFLK